MKLNTKLNYSLLVVYKYIGHLISRLHIIFGEIAWFLKDVYF